MSRKGKQILALLLALALLCTALSGCGGRRSDDPDSLIPASTGGKDLERARALDKVFSLNSNSHYSFKPMVATNHANQLVCALVYENMVELDNNFNIIEGAGLITEWTVSEDGRSWEFTVDTSHVFHDGTNVSPYDLRMSLENAINSDRFSGRFRNVWGVSHDEQKMYVTLGKGNTQFIKLLNIPVCKARTFGDDYPEGSGPYMWNEEHTELRPFTGYNGYDQLPVPVVYIQEYPDAAGILSAFEDSVIDVVTNDPSSYTSLGYASTNETRDFATTNMHFIAFNEDGALGRYSNIRTALSYGVNRAYFEELMKGNGVGTPVPMVPGCAAYPEELAASHQFDLEKCKLILENYGIMDYDGDGRLELSSGNNADLTMTMILSSDSSVKIGMARRFAEDMASIGLTINIRELKWDEYIQALEERQVGDEPIDFDLYYGETRLRNDFDLTELVQVRTKDNQGSNLNYTASTDRSFETYNDNYLAARSDRERKDQYGVLAQYLLQDGMFITIGFEKQQLITHRGVCKGADPNFGNPLYNFANWTIDLG